MATHQEEELERSLELAGVLHSEAAVVGLHTVAPRRILEVLGADTGTAGRRKEALEGHIEESGHSPEVELGDRIEAVAVGRSRDEGLVAEGHTGEVGRLEEEAVLRGLQDLLRLVDAPEAIK